MKSHLNLVESKFNVIDGGLRAGEDWWLSYMIAWKSEHTPP